MKIERLENILEAILFMSGNGLSLSELAEILGLQKSEINKALAALKEKYGGNSGIKLIMFGNKIQFGTNPEYAAQIAQVLNPIKEKELSNAALETIAIVAYRQPVTRLEIEQIRGVNCDYAVQILLKHNLIEVVGRKEAVGKPLLFGTTDDFLKRFQITSIDELPDYEALLESIRVINSRDRNQDEAKPQKGLYNEFEIPEETSDAASETVAPDAMPEEDIPDFLRDEAGLKKTTGD